MKKEFVFLTLLIGLLVGSVFAVDYTEFLTIAPAGTTDLNTDGNNIYQTFTGNANYSLYIITYKESGSSANSPPTTIQINLSLTNGTQIGYSNFVNFALDSNYHNISFVSPVDITNGTTYLLRFYGIAAGVLGLDKATTNPYLGGSCYRQEDDGGREGDLNLKFWGLLPEVPGNEEPLVGNNSACIRLYATRHRVMWNQSQFSYLEGDNYENIIFPGSSIVLNSLTLPANYSYCSEYIGTIATGGVACFPNVTFEDSYYVRFHPNLNCYTPPNSPDFTFYTLGTLYIENQTNASYVFARSDSPVVENTGGIKTSGRIGSMFYEILNIAGWVIIAIAVVMSVAFVGISNGGWVVALIVFAIGVMIKMYIGKWGL